jgi:hypothetical protein
MKVLFSHGTARGKKMKAVFYNDNDKKIKTIQFGQAGAQDYTLTKNKEQRERYIKRHTNSRENHNKYMSAGSLSRYILWGSSTSKAINIQNYKKRFNLKTKTKIKI